jgi:hypothetical protein
MNPYKCITCFCMVGVIIMSTCSKPRQVSGIEITNGNCIGKIFNQDGLGAKNAKVKLIPVNYNPYSQIRDSIDSTFTNANGDYGFMVTQPNYYTIVAEKGSTSCKQDSIFVQAEAKTIVDNDTLRESGTLSGVIRLKPGDDTSRVVILVLGTNVYTVPSDTSGRFSTPLLPKGNYTIQIFTTLAGYAVFDTNVTILEGAQTELDVILPSSNAPSITKLTATYDSATMFVSLTWQMPDASNIVSYALYRNSRLGKDTMRVLDKSALSYTDDVIGLDGDTLSYEIAGIGKNYKEGYRTVAQSSIVCGKVYCIKKIDLSPIAAGLPHISNVSVFSDRADEIFLVGAEGIFKLDSNGVVRKDFVLESQDTHGIEYLSGYLQSDDRGYLYIGRTNHGVVKLDRNLNVLSERKIDAEWFEVMGNGTTWCFETDNPSSGTRIILYDSAGSILRDSSVWDRSIYGWQPIGDTIVTYEYHHADQPSADQPLIIHYYDKAFKALSVFMPVDFSKSAWLNPRFESQRRYDGFIAAPNGVFVSNFDATDASDASLLVFTDAKGEFLARIAVPAARPWPRGISFDGRGNMYLITYYYTQEEDMSYNPMTALYIYTLRPLVRKNVP